MLTFIWHSTVMLKDWERATVTRTSGLSGFGMWMSELPLVQFLCNPFSFGVVSGLTECVLPATFARCWWKLEASLKEWKGDMLQVALQRAHPHPIFVCCLEP